MFRVLLSRVVGLAVLVLATQTFVAIGWLRPVEVVGDSMSPAYESGDRLLVRRWTIPRRWQTVLLRDPSDARRMVLKRVVGRPGERVELRGGRVWIDGRQQPRNPEVDRSVYYAAWGNPSWSLGPDEWLVLGDNQSVSIDSRNWDAPPCLPNRLLVGVSAGRIPYSR